MFNSILTIILLIACFLVIAILLFFRLREVFCWYYKINQRIIQNQEQIGLLKTLVALQKQAINKKDE